MPAHLKYPRVPGENPTDRKKRLQKLRYQNDPDIRARRNAYSSASVKRKLARFTPDERHAWNARRYAVAKNKNPVAWAMKQRKGNLERKYRLTPFDYEQLKAIQGNRCAICGQIPTPTRNAPDGFHVDHCHATQAVRSLLCSGCNVGLGSFRDDPQRLIEAAAYVVAHQALQEKAL